MRVWSSVGSKSIAGSPSDRRADVPADEADDLLGRGAGREDLLDAQRLERRDVLGRDDPAAEDHDVLRALLPEKLEDALEEVVVGARQHREVDRVGVLLDCGRLDRVGRWMCTSVVQLYAP